MQKVSFQVSPLAKHVSLRERVSAHLRDAITSGLLRPGEKLKERELCERLAISRPSLREALRSLEAEHLIVNIPNKGPEVARLTLREAKDLYAMRRLLESFAARAFTELATDEQVQALEATTQKLAAAALSGVGADVIGAKTEFYSVLLSGCGNSLVQETLGGLLTRVSLLRATSLLNPQRLPKSMKEIQALMVAIKSRDAASAERVSKRHLLNAERAAIEAFEKQLTIF